MVDNVFFVIGAFRSGTTALAKILDSATNAKVFVEQPPKLSKEARELYGEKLENPRGCIEGAKGGAIKSVLDQGRHYGDKNANYLPFIPHLADLWPCKFVFVVRDGRDVVRSLMDWQHVTDSRLYERDEDGDEFNHKRIEEDYWDYSLIRPRPETPLSKQWRSLDKFSKFSWYWSEYNKVLLSHMHALSVNRYSLVDMTQVSTCDIESLFAFLHLDGFNSENIDRMMTGRINQASDRGQVGEMFRPWFEWSNSQTEAFDQFAAPVMKELGYVT